MMDVERLSVYVYCYADHPGLSKEAMRADSSLLNIFPQPLFQFVPGFLPSVLALISLHDGM